MKRIALATAVAGLMALLTSSASAGPVANDIRRADFDRALALTDGIVAPVQLVGNCYRGGYGADFYGSRRGFYSSRSAYYGPRVQSSYRYSTYGNRGYVPYSRSSVYFGTNRGYRGYRGGSGVGLYIGF